MRHCRRQVGCVNDLDLTKQRWDGPPRRLWLECGALALLLAIAAALRIPGLFQGYWGDELYTLCAGMWPLDKLLSGKMAASTFTPLAFLVVKGTLALFPAAAQVRFPGEMPVTAEVIPTHLDEWVLRLPFFCISLITLVVLFLLVRRYFGLNAAFWAGLFLAVSPEHIGYSSELRFYGMVCLAGAVLVYGVQRVLDGGGWRGWTLTALGLLLGLPTHLSFLFVTAGVMGGAVLSLLLDAVSWRRRMGVAAGLAALCAAVMVLQVGVTVAFSPAPLDEMRLLFSGQKVVASEDMPDAGADGASPADTSFERPVQRYQLGVGEYFAGFIGGRFLACHGVLCGVLLAAVLLAGMAGLYARRRSLLFMIVGVLLVPAPLFALHVNHRWLHRYFLFDIVLCAVVAGVGMTVLFRGLRRWTGGETRPRAGIAACAVLGLLAVLVYAPSLAAGRALGADSHVDGGMREMSETLAASIAPTDRLLFLQPYKVRLSYQLVPYYLGRMRPDWAGTGVLSKMTLCNDTDAFNAARAKMPGGGFWVVSFDDNNRDVRLNEAVAAAGGVRLAQYSDSSLWRVGGAELRAVNLLADTTPGVELPAGGQVLESGAFRVALAENSEDDLQTPTVLFPVVRDENGNPATGLKPDTAHTLRFRLQLEGIVPGSNRTRTFRVMLFAKEGTTDLMYAEGTASGEDYTITFTPGEYLPETLTNVKIGFGIRGGTGAFQVENVTLQSCAVPSR